MAQAKYVDFGISDAPSFFQKIAMPNVTEFRNDPTIQHGLNAAWALWHLLEWYWHTERRKSESDTEGWKAFKDGFTEECSALRLLQDITDAAKHCGIDRTDHKIAGFAQVSGRHGAGGYDVAGGYNVGGLAYGSGLPELIAYCDDGSRFWLVSVIDEAVTFWAAKFGLEHLKTGDVVDGLA